MTDEGIDYSDMDDMIGFADENQENTDNSNQDNNSDQDNNSQSKSQLEKFKDNERKIQEKQTKSKANNGQTDDEESKEAKQKKIEEWKKKIKEKNMDTAKNKKQSAKSNPDQSSNQEENQEQGQKPKQAKSDEEFWEKAKQMVEETSKQDEKHESLVQSVSDPMITVDLLPPIGTYWDQQWISVFKDVGKFRHYSDNLNKSYAGATTNEGTAYNRKKQKYNQYNNKYLDISTGLFNVHDYGSHLEFMELPDDIYYATWCIVGYINFKTLHFGQDLSKPKMKLSASVKWDLSQDENGNNKVEGDDIRRANELFSNMNYENIIPRFRPKEIQVKLYKLNSSIFKKTPEQIDRILNDDTNHDTNQS